MLAKLWGALLLLWAAAGKPRTSALVAPAALEIEPLDARVVTPEEAWQRAGIKPPLEQYQKGLGEIITLLDTQRRTVELQRSLLEVKNLRIQNRLNLYLALGGDFESAVVLE